MRKYKSKKIQKGFIKYLPVLIILLSITIMAGSTFAYFNNRQDKTGTLTFSKVELSSETSAGVNGQIRDVIPGTKLVDGDLSFAKAVDSQAMYVRAKISFSLPTELKEDEKMIELLEALRLSSNFNVKTEPQNGAVWSNKMGNYYYLLDADDNSKLKRVDDTATYTLASEIIIPYDLEQLEDKYQYMKTINFHVAFEAIQADNVSDAVDGAKEVFNLVFPEEDTQVIVLTITQYNNNDEEAVTTELQLGDTFNEPIVEKDGFILDGWYTKDGSEDGDWGEKITFPFVVSESISIHAKWISEEKQDYTIDEIYWVGASSVDYSGNPVRPYLEFNDANIKVEYTYLRDYGDAEVESTPIDAGSYIARAVLSHVDTSYNVVNNVGEFLYIINPIEVNASGASLTDTTSFTYNGEWQTPIATNLPSGVSAIYNYKVGGVNTYKNSIDANDYQLNVTLVGDNNHYVVNAPTLEANFTIERKDVDMSSVFFDWGFGSELTAYEYTGYPVKPVLNDVPDGVNIEYVYTDYQGNIVENPTERGAYYVDLNLDSPNYNFINVQESVKNYRFVIGGEDLDLSKLVWNVEDIYRECRVNIMNDMLINEVGLLTYTGNSYTFTLTNNTGLDLEITYEDNPETDNDNLSQTEVGSYYISANVRLIENEKARFINNFNQSVSLSYKIVKNDYISSINYNGDDISYIDLLAIETFNKGDTLQIVPNSGYTLSVTNSEGEVELTNNTFVFEAYDAYSIYVNDSNGYSVYIEELERKSFECTPIYLMNINGKQLTRLLSGSYLYDGNVVNNISSSYKFDKTIDIKIEDFGIDENITLKYEVKYIDNEVLSTFNITDLSFVIENADTVEYITIYYELDGNREEYVTINVYGGEDLYMGANPTWNVKGLNLLTGKTERRVTYHGDITIWAHNFLYSYINFADITRSAVDFNDYYYNKNTVTEVRDYTIKLFTDEELTNEVEYTNLNLQGGELYVAHYNLQNEVVGVRKETQAGVSLLGDLKLNTINRYYVYEDGAFTRSYSFNTGVNYSSKVAGKDSVEVKDEFTSVIHKLEFDYNNEKYIYQKPVIIINDELTQKNEFEPLYNGNSILDYFETGVDNLSDIDLTQITYELRDNYFANPNEVMNYEIVNIFGFNYLKFYFYGSTGGADIKFSRILLNGNNSFDVGADIKLVSSESQQIVTTSTFALDLETQSLNVTLNDNYANAIIYGPDGFAKAGAVGGVLNYKPTSAGEHVLAIVSSNDRNVKYYTINVTGEVQPAVRVEYRDNELKQYLDSNNTPNIGDFTFEMQESVIVLRGELDVIGVGFSGETITIDSIGIGYEGALYDGATSTLIGDYNNAEFKVNFDGNSEYYIHLQFIATGGQVVNIYITLIGYEIKGATMIEIVYNGNAITQSMNESGQPTLGDFTFEPVNETTISFIGNLDVSGAPITGDTLTYDSITINFDGNVYDGVLNNGEAIDVLTNVELKIATSEGKVYNIIHFVANTPDGQMNVYIYVYLDGYTEAPGAKLFTITYKGDELAQYANANQEPAIGDFVYERIDEYNIRLRGAIDVAGETFDESYIVLDGMTVFAEGEIYDAVTMNRIYELSNIKLKIDDADYSVKLMFKTLTNPTYTTIITLVLKNFNVENVSFATINYKDLVLNQTLDLYGLPTDGDFEYDVVRDNLVVLKHDLDASKEDVSDGYIKVDNIEINTSSMIYDYVRKVEIENNTSVDLKITSINDSYFVIISTSNTKASVFIVFRLLGVNGDIGGGNGGDDNEELQEIINMVYGSTTLSQKQDTAGNMSGDFNVTESNGDTVFTATIDVTGVEFIDEYITFSSIELNITGEVYDAIANDNVEITSFNDVRLFVGRDTNYYVSLLIVSGDVNTYVNIVLTGYSEPTEPSEGEVMVSMVIDGDTFTAYSDGSGDFTQLVDGENSSLIKNLQVSDEVINSGKFLIDSLTINIPYTSITAIIQNDEIPLTSFEDIELDIIPNDESNGYNVVIIVTNVVEGTTYRTHIILNLNGDNIGVEQLITMNMNGSEYVLNADGSGDFTVGLDGDNTYLSISLNVTDELITSGTFTIDSMTIVLDYTRVYKMVNISGTQEDVSIDTAFTVAILNDGQSNIYMAGIGIENISQEGNSYYAISINFIGETLGENIGGGTESSEELIVMTMLGNRYVANSDGSGDLGDIYTCGLLAQFYVSDDYIMNGVFTVDNMIINLDSYTGLTSQGQEITDLNNITLDIIYYPSDNVYQADINIEGVNHPGIPSTEIYITINFIGETLGRYIEHEYYTETDLSISILGEHYNFFNDGTGDFIYEREEDTINLFKNIYVTDDVINNGTLTIENIGAYSLNGHDEFSLDVYNQALEPVSFELWYDIPATIIEDTENNKYFIRIKVVSQRSDEDSTYYTYNIILNLVGETLGTPDNLVQLMAIEMNGDTYNAYEDGYSDFDYCQWSNNGSDILFMHNLYVADELINSGTFTIENLVINRPYTVVMSYDENMQSVVIDNLNNITLDILANPQANQYAVGLIISELDGDNVVSSIQIVIYLIGETLGSEIEMEEPVEQLLTIEVQGEYYYAYSDGSGNFQSVIDENTINLLLNLNVTDELINSGTFKIDMLQLMIAHSGVYKYTSNMQTELIERYDNITLDIIANTETNQYMSGIMISDDSGHMTYITINFVGETLGREMNI